MYYNTALTGENDGGADPLPAAERVAEDDDRAQDCEELACGGGDGTGQGAEVRHHQEDEELTNDI